MSRRTAVAVCLAFGLLSVPGVALAVPSWTVPPDVPAWGGDERGDVCDYRGDPPCHTTTTPAVIATSQTGTSSTGATTTTTDVAGTTGTSVAATSATSTTSVPSTTSTTSTTSTVGTTTSTLSLATTVPAGAPSTPRLASSTSSTALAATGVTPLWTGLGALVVLLAGSALLVFARRRRA